MFERVDAAVDRAPDRRVRVEMGGDIGAHILGLLDHGGQLLAREARKWIGSDGEATPPLAMTLRKSAPVRNCSRAARRHSGTPSQMTPIVPKRPGSLRSASVERSAQIAMPACLRQRLAAEIEPWQRQRRHAHGLAEPARGTAQIAHGRKAAHQHGAHLVHRADGDDGIGQCRIGLQVHLYRVDVDMGVNQARHHEIPCRINHLRLGARAQSRTGFLNVTVRHTDVDRIQGAVRRAIHNAGVLDQYVSHREVFPFG